MDGRPELEIVKGPGRGARFTLLADQIVIGSADDCDVRLDAVPGVSRRHAELFRDPGGSGWRLRDLDSLNGVIVGGVRVQNANLPDSGEFALGKATLRLAPAASPARGVVVVQTASGKGRDRTAAETGGSGERALSGAGGSMAPVWREAGVSETSGESPEAVLSGLGAGSGRALATAALLAGLLALAVYGAAWISGGESRRTGPWTRILSVNQEKAIYSRRDFSSFDLPEKAEDGGEYARVREYNGLLSRGVAAANERLRQRGYPLLRFLVVQGRQPTRGRPIAVRLKNAAGEVVESIPIVVAGRRPRDDIDEAGLDDRTRADLANKWVLEAWILAADNYSYLAMRNYERAEATAQDIGRGDKALEFSLEAERLRSRVVREAGDRFQNAVDAAFPDRAGGLGRRDLVAAFRLFEEIKRMIPDETSPDWQVVDYWQMLLRRLADDR